MTQVFASVPAPDPTTGQASTPAQGGGNVIVCLAADMQHAVYPDAQGGCPNGYTKTNLAPHGSLGGGQMPGYTSPTGIPSLNIPNPVGDAVANIEHLTGYTHTILAKVTDPGFWKGTGLILAGGVVLIIGFLMWSGIGGATLEATPQAQTYRRMQAGGVRAARAPKEEAAE